jgi:hypothetical protein
VEREEQAPIHARKIAKRPSTLKKKCSETRTEREGVCGKLGKKEKRGCKVRRVRV